MFGGIGVPRANGEPGRQQIGGGCSAGRRFAFPMFCVFGMYSGWCGTTIGWSPALAPAASSEAASRPAANAAVMSVFFTVWPPLSLSLDGERRGRDRGRVVALGRTGIQRVLA